MLSHTASYKQLFPEHPGQQDQGVLFIFYMEKVKKGGVYFDDIL